MNAWGHLCGHNKTHQFIPQLKERQISKTKEHRHTHTQQDTHLIDSKAH